MRMRLWHAGIWIAVYCLSTPAVEIGGGVLAGLSLARQYGDDLSDLENTAGFDLDLKPGLSGGGFVDLWLTDIVAVEPSLFFLMKGMITRYSLDVPGQYLEGTSYARLNYLEFPVLLKVAIPIRSAVAPFVEAGASPAILLGAETETVSNGDSYTDHHTEDYLNTFDFGIPFGAGVEIELSSRVSLVLVFKATIGVTRTAEKPDQGPRADNRNVALSMLGGVCF